jgi:acyl carrier protein|tara:strand:- start:370 stop:612 length:243 start_codon:yes stop_codon:yes gene_type:complete
MTALQKKVYQIFVKVLKLKSANVLNDKSSPKTINSWDSLAHIEIITNLNKAFKIDINFEDLMKINNLKDVFKILKKYNVK